VARERELREEAADSGRFILADSPSKRLRARAARFLEQLGASRGSAAPPVSNGCDGQPGTPAEAVEREHEASHEPVRAELEHHRARAPSPRGPRGGVVSKAHGPGAEAA